MKNALVAFITSSQTRAFPQLFINNHFEILCGYNQSARDYQERYEIFITSFSIGKPLGAHSSSGMRLRSGE